MNKKPTFRRVFAFLIDMFIISMIASMFANLELINPYIEEYEKVSQEYLSYVSEITDVSKMMDDEKLQNFTYDIAHYGVYTSIITLVVTILYFVVFQFYNNGRTIGKALLKIKVITGNKKLKISQFLLRSLFVNSIVTSIILIICLFNLSKDSYIKVSEIVQIIDMGVLFLCFGLMIYREDGRGLHDLIGNTIVVRNEENIVNEAKIVERKKGKKNNENRNR